MLECDQRVGRVGPGHRRHFDDDRLSGDVGNDTLSGNYGIDTLTGGDGADLFRFSRDDANVDFAGGRIDRITDLSGDDRIGLPGGVPDRIVQAGSFGDLGSAANWLRGQIADQAHAVGVATVGGATVLFFSVERNGHVEAVGLDGVAALAVDAHWFV